MQTVAELKNPFLEYWMFRYGSVFVLGYCGIVMAAIRFWKTRGVLLAVPLTLFTITTFYRSRLDSLWGTATGNLLFGAAVVTCIIGFIVLAWRRQRTPENESTYITFVLWFLFWAALTRDAKTLRLLYRDVCRFFRLRPYLFPRRFLWQSDQKTHPTTPPKDRYYHNHAWDHTFLDTRRWARNAYAARRDLFPAGDTGG